MSLEIVSACPAARRSRTAAVGLTSPVSMRESDAQLTLIDAASASSDQRRCRGNSRSRPRGGGLAANPVR